MKSSGMNAKARKQKQLAEPPRRQERQEID
jgi:hypothetical protein